MLTDLFTYIKITSNYSEHARKDKKKPVGTNGITWIHSRDENNGELSPADLKSENSREF